MSMSPAQAASVGAVKSSEEVAYLAAVGIVHTGYLVMESISGG